MRRLFASFVLSSAFFLVACGAGGVPARAPTASQALTSAAELLELESPAVRQDLFREVARTSMLQAGLTSKGPVLFPLVRNGEVIAAPGFDPRTDLLVAPDAGEGIQLSFDGRGDRWSNERRESLQGLSEREAAELISRTLLTTWGVHPSGAVEVHRTPGAPYAAAYMDGVLQLNPAFIYLATSAVSASSLASVQ